MRAYSLLFILLIGCSTVKIDSSQYRLYQISDMEDSLQDYFANKIKRINPGLACDAFRMNNITGCFKLIVDKRHGKVIKLIYEEPPNRDKLEIYSFDPPRNDIFIEKVFDREFKSTEAVSEEFYKEVTLEEGQPSLLLEFDGKSSVVFYWKDGEFNEIWTSD